MTSTPRNELRNDARPLDTQMQWTNRALAQFAFAGVQPYTMNFARVSAVDYCPSMSGERIINHCLTNLPVYVAADDKLQFGWHETYLYRNTRLHEFEYQPLLLVAALSESLPETYAAAVLNCLSRKYEDDVRIQPTIASWTRMVRSLNGLLTTSEFALIIDDRMRLDPYRVTSGHSTSCTNSLISPADFAKALQALNNLSSAGTGELTLVGGNFLGWFAAFAELFLGLNVHISSRDGHELFSTHNGSKATLRLIFLEDMKSDLLGQLQLGDQNSIRLAVMCAPDAEVNTIPRIPFTGRVGWEALLPKVFESSFHRIAHQDSKCFVQSVGGVARLFSLLVEDPNTPEDAVSKDNRLNPASWGVGLIQTLCNWFPEMRHLQGRLERLQGPKVDMAEASLKCEEGAQGFAKICGCSICGNCPFMGPDGNITFPKNDHLKLPESFCLLAIMETILNLGLAMSRITVTPSVYPSRAGILCVYRRQVQKLLYAQTQTKKPQLLEFERMKLLFLNDWNANYSRRLQTAAAIFSGSWPEGDTPENLCALKHEGICAYVMDVQYGDKSTKQRRDKDVIRVQAGHVAYNQKVFSRVTTGPPKGISSTDYSWEEVEVSHMSRKLYFK